MRGHYLKFYFRHAVRVVLIAFAVILLVTPKKPAVAAKAIGTISVGVRILPTPGNGKPLAPPRTSNTTTTDAATTTGSGTTGDAATTPQSGR